MGKSLSHETMFVDGSAHIDSHSNLGTIYGRVHRERSWQLRQGVDLQQS
jgi:hypothetical protein